jgi:hypothetical protein
VDKQRFHLVEQPANDDCQMRPAARAPLPPVPPLPPVRMGRPTGCSSTIMPAFLHCYCRLFVNPLKHRLAQAARATHSRLPDPDRQAGF